MRNFRYTKIFLFYLDLYDDYYPHAWADTADQVIINLYEQLIQKEVIDRL